VSKRHEMVIVGTSDNRADNASEQGLYVDGKYVGMPSNETDIFVPLSLVIKRGFTVRYAKGLPIQPGYWPDTLAEIANLEMVQ
jgi:hypothetical protein